LIPSINRNVPANGRLRKNDGYPLTLWVPHHRHFFQFDKEENSDKVLRRKIEGLISKASGDELQRAYRLLSELLKP